MSQFLPKLESHKLYDTYREQAIETIGEDLKDDIKKLGVQIITPALIEHLISTEEPVSEANFITMGLSGGHDEERFQAFVRSHPRYVLLPEGKAKKYSISLAGHAYPIQVSRYRQYRWQGRGPTPQTDNLRPPQTEECWIQSDTLKTTVDTLYPFLMEARSVYAQWCTDHPRFADGEAFGATPAKPFQPRMVSASGLEFAGFVKMDPASRQRRVWSVFPVVT